MFKNFVTISLRHLNKHKAYAVLNIIGLSIGLACFTLISLWVKSELSYDRFHVNADRIYRVANTFTDESSTFQQAVTPIPLAPAVIADLPEIENAVRIDVSDAVVKLGNAQFIEDDILAVDPSFFDIFSFKLLQGNTATALNEPYSIVLSESMAKKYFRDGNPMGHSLKIYLFDPDGNGAEYKVTGIVEDCPANSHFNYKFLVSFKTVETVNPVTMNSWYNNSYFTYVLLKPQVDPRTLHNKLETFLEKYIGKEMAEYRFKWTYFLQPLTDIHLKSNIRYEIGPTTSMSYVLMFATTGLIVLVLACINYINLSTAFASDRFKEIGVRKLMGAYRDQLITQHLVESWLIAMIAFIIGIALIEVARPLFEALTGKTVTGLYTPAMLGVIALIASAAGIVSGFYPALVISSFGVANVLKGKFTSGKSAAWLRKTLVVVQYSITIVLIAGTLIVQLQMKFIREKDLGFNKENLLVLNVNGSNEVQNSYDGFMQELLSNPDLVSMARSNTMLAGGLGNSGASAADASGKQINSTIFRMRVDHDFIPAYGMTLVAGRNFIAGSAADSAGGFIVNEATTKIYGFTDPSEMVGREMSFNGIDGKIIGVVKDFHYNTLQKQIEPTCMYLLDGSFSRIAIRMRGDIHKNIETVSEAWRKFFPESIFDYSFAEDRLLQQYQSEQRFSRLFLAFSFISLAIACLGLFSLVSYAVEHRTKEIGIRKVLGASVTAITMMMSKEFVLLIFVSCCIAIPFSYYFMNEWLNHFAYRISPDIYTFLAAMSIAFIIALLTIGLKSIRAALANPVDSLKNE